MDNTQKEDLCKCVGSQSIKKPRTSTNLPGLKVFWANMKCFDPTITRSVTLKSKSYLLGDKFYLKNFSDWDENIRDWLAQKENTKLTSEHLIVIEFLRKSYCSNNRHPAVRMVTTELAKRLGEDKGLVKYFHSLFPGGIHQAFLIAGLPMMDSCC